MDKRDLKRYPIKMAGKSIVSQACRIEKIDYFLYARTALIAHQRMLVVSLYERGKLIKGERHPSYRIFMTNKEYITQDFSEDKPVWRTGCMENLIEIKWYHKISIVCCDDRSVEVINHFFAYLQKDQLSPSEKLMEAQKRIMDARLKKRYKAEMREISKKMRVIKKLPKDFMEWIDEAAMAHSRYIYYKYSRKKVMDGYCTHCHSEVKVSGAKHRKKAFAQTVEVKLCFWRKEEQVIFWIVDKQLIFRKQIRGLL